MKSKGDLERERDELKAEVDNNNNKVLVLERTTVHLKKAIDNKVVTNTKLALIRISNIVITLAGVSHSPSNFY